MATAFLPALLTGWFVAVPWIDRDGQRRRLVRGVGAVLVVLLAALSIPGAWHEIPARPAPTPPLGMTHAERGGFLLLRGLRCLECHHWRRGEQVFFYGDQEQEALEAPDLFDIEVETEADIGVFLDMTIEGGEDMPSYELVPEEQLRSIAFGDRACGYQTRHQAAERYRRCGSGPGRSRLDSRRPHRASGPDRPRRRIARRSPARDQKGRGGKRLWPLHGRRRRAQSGQRVAGQQYPL